MNKEEMNINAIINPNRALEKLKEKIVNIYERSYGDKSREVIKRKLNGAIYIFDSNPIKTREFYIKNLGKIKDNRLLLRTELEYFDYVREVQKIERNINSLFLNYLKKFFYINPLTDISKLLELDFDAYSLENTMLYDKVDTSEEVRKEIERRRIAYKYACLEAGVKEVKDLSSIENILKHKHALELLKKVEIIRNTKWGRRIKRRILEDNGIELSDIQLSEILFKDDDEKALTTVTRLEDGTNKTVCYIPLIENIDTCNLDRMLLHELRHVVETKESGSGISSFAGRKYELLNEIRTDLNAMEDEKLINGIIFSRKNRKAKSAYEMLIPYTSDFFVRNSNILNNIALYGDSDLLEEYYDKDSLTLFEYNLRSILSRLTGGEMVFDYRSNDNLVESMNNNYKCYIKR